MKMRFVLAAFAILAALPVSARADGLALKFSRTEQASEAKAQPRAYSVVLLPDALEVHDGQQDRYYDFDAKRLYLVDPQARSYRSYSLHAVPVFNHERKAALDKAAYAKLQGRPGAPARPADFSDPGIDMLYGSARDTKSDGALSTAFSDNRTSFTVNGKPLAEFSASATDIPEALKPSFAHFLIYEAALHPAIEKAIEATGKAPAMLHYTTSAEGAVDDVMLTLTGAEKTAQTGLLLPVGLKRTWSGNDELDDAIRKTAGQPLPSLQEAERGVQEMLDRKDTLRALLKADELALMLGVDAFRKSAVAQAALKAAQSDPVAKATQAAIETPARTTAEFEQTMKQLNTAEDKAPDLRYIIELLRARHIRSVLGQRREALSQQEAGALMGAMSKITDAIIANPWLTAAYCDLADAYYSQDQVQQAWIFWEQAAKLDPQFPNLAHIAGMERQAEKDFPEYF